MLHDLTKLTLADSYCLSSVSSLAALTLDTIFTSFKSKSISGVQEKLPEVGRADSFTANPSA